MGKISLVALEAGIQGNFMAPLRQLEPKELIRGIHKGQIIPWIDSLGTSCLRAAI